MNCVTIHITIVMSNSVQDDSSHTCIFRKTLGAKKKNTGYNIKNGYKWT